MKSGFVALAGRPNAGKSTLINALVKEKIAIVSDKPQTTRSQIRGIVNTEDSQIIFSDLPGVHKAKHRLEVRMNKETSNVIQGVDLIYLVVDGSVPFSSGDEYVLRMVAQTKLPVFLIFNKIDKMPKEKVLNHLQSWQKRFDFAEFFPITALHGSRFEDLLETTKKYLPEGPKMYPDNMVSDNSENFRIAEIIREKILYCTEQEVPHSTAVLVETKEYVNGKYHIGAVIHVEKSGQKGILIGKQGTMLKKIGSLAREDIEKMLRHHVYLELFVRVEDEWRNRDNRITEFGYGNIDE